MPQPASLARLKLVKHRIALKDLLEVVLDRKSPIFLVVMPVVFTLFMGLAFRVTETETRLPLGWVDGDPEGTLGSQLCALVAATDGIEVLPLADDEAKRVDEQVQEGEPASAVIVPPGWSASRVLCGGC